MRIEELRSNLHKQIADYDKLTDEAVIEMSQELDAALIDYFREGSRQNGEYRKVSY